MIFLLKFKAEARSGSWWWIRSRWRRIDQPRSCSRNWLNNCCIPSIASDYRHTSQWEVTSNCAVIRSIWGAVTTAPPKPSVQTQLILGRIADREEKEDERWGQVMEHLDLLFAKVAEIDTNQHKMDARVDMSTKVMEQLLKDQQLLAKQMEATGQAVARLTLDSMGKANKEPLSPTSSDISMEQGFHNPFAKDGQGTRSGFTQNRREFGGRLNLNNLVPKMAFPRFEGDNPCIWKDKCLNYFQLFELPPTLWATMASPGMDGKAAKWLQVHKQKHGLGSWETFIKVVEAKFWG